VPYKIKGSAVVKRDSGKVVGHSKNPKKYLRTLQAIEHGFKPTRKVDNGFYHNVENCDRSMMKKMRKMM